MRVDEAKSLLEVAARQKCILMVGDKHCYHPAILKLRQLIQTGQLGKTYYIYSNKLDHKEILSQKTNTFRFAKQDISIAPFLLDEMPTFVSCRGNNNENNVQLDGFDIMLTALEFNSGVQAHFFSHRLSPDDDEKILVMGDRGVAVFGEKTTNNKLVLCENAVSWVNKAPFPISSKQNVIDVENEEPLCSECREFLNCISNCEAPITDGQHGLRVACISDACWRSLQERGKTILIDGIDSKEPVFYVHETSVVDNYCSIGKGTKIWHFCHLMPGVTVGEKCILGQNTFLGRGVSIGNNVKIQNNVSIYEGVLIEDDVFCGPSCVFTHITNPRAHIPRRDKFLATIIKKGATIGANSTILGGITIGRYAFIGAGAVVTRDVPDYALVHGNPARFRGWRCQCGTKLDFNKEHEAKCPSCGFKYRKHRSDTAVTLIPSAVQPQDSVESHFFKSVPIGVAK
jgi:UDP-2-acetamido-3-amino-2,3-dideoxy-glucuronate N-acetyltransferase